MIEHLDTCRPEHLTTPDWEGLRDCTNCGLWERIPELVELNEILEESGEAPTSLEELALAGIDLAVGA